MSRENCFVSEIHTYPVKSCAGIALEEASLTPRGIEFDRCFMVVTESLGFMTQREIPKMAQILTRIAGAELLLSAPGQEVLALPLHGGGRNPTPVVMRDSTCMGVDQGPYASSWLTDFLGQYKGENLKLLSFYLPFVREVDPFYTGSDHATTAFSDGFPFLVTSEASLAELNRRILENGGEAVPMNRFRPNIVISGVEPFEEDTISELRFPRSHAALKLAKPCARCVITRTDQTSGQVHRTEPLKTLGQFRVFANQKGERGAMFGQNAYLIRGAGEQIVPQEPVEVLYK